MVVCRENDLGVTLSHELRIVGFLLQLRTELDVVVDLPVEQDRIALRRVGRTPTQRLVGVVEINDGQAVEAEDDVSVVPGPSLVGSAMPLAAQRSRPPAAVPRPAASCRAVGSPSNPHTRSAPLISDRTLGWQAPRRPSMTVGYRTMRPGRGLAVALV